jgi:hypothetical protein
MELAAKAREWTNSREFVENATGRGQSETFYSREGLLARAFEALSLEFVSLALRRLEAFRSGRPKRFEAPMGYPGNYSTNMDSYFARSKTEKSTVAYRSVIEQSEHFPCLRGKCNQ